MKKEMLILIIISILLTSACNYEKEEKLEKKVMEEKEPIFSCEDTDGGYEPGKAGTVTRYVDDEKTISKDECTTEFKLVEIYCDENQIKTKEADCSHGCLEGKCLTEAEADELEAKEQLDEQLQEQYDKEKLEKELEETKRLEEEQRKKELEAIQDEFYNCFNGFKDPSFETDVDCGGLCAQGCGFGKACKENDDCAQGLVCNIRSKTCSTLKH